jgi:hypothetical protein
MHTYYAIKQLNKKPCIVGMVQAWRRNVANKIAEVCFAKKKSDKAYLYVQPKGFVDKRKEKYIWSKFKKVLND